MDILKTGIALVLALGVSACLEKPATPEGPDYYSIGPKTPISCGSPTAGYDLSGCWIAERCLYSPADWIKDRNNPQYSTEDYWIHQVYNATVESTPFTHLGATDFTEGKLVESILYYGNENCGGEPVFYGNPGGINYYYKFHTTFTTARGFLAKVLMRIFPGVTVGAAQENGRTYVTTSLNSGRLCFGDESSLQIPVTPENQGLDQTYASEIDDSQGRCFTRLTYTNQTWLTNNPPDWSNIPALH